MPQNVLHFTLKKSYDESALPWEWFVTLRNIFKRFYLHGYQSFMQTVYLTSWPRSCSICTYKILCCAINIKGVMIVLRGWGWGWVVVVRANPYPHYWLIVRGFFVVDSSKCLNKPPSCRLCGMTHVWYQSRIVFPPERYPYYKADNLYHLQLPVSIAMATGCNFFPCSCSPHHVLRPYRFRV